MIQIFDEGTNRPRGCYWNEGTGDIHVLCASPWREPRKHAARVKACPINLWYPKWRGCYLPLLQACQLTDKTCFGGGLQSVRWDHAADDYQETWISHEEAAQHMLSLGCPLEYGWADDGAIASIQNTHPTKSRHDNRVVNRVPPPCQVLHGWFGRNWPKALGLTFVSSGAARYCQATAENVTAKSCLSG